MNDDDTPTRARIPRDRDEMAAAETTTSVGRLDHIGQYLRPVQHDRINFYGTYGFNGDAELQARRPRPA